MITHYLSKRWALPALAIAVLISASSWIALSAQADVSDNTVSAASGGAVVYDQNGGSSVQSFSPELGSTLEANATSSVTAYYGAEVTTASSSPDVHWSIDVDAAAQTLASGMVTITQKGYFNATTHTVSDSPYTANVSGNDLVFTSGSFSLNPGDDVTDVDGITFDQSAPLGTYTITRELVDASGTPVSNQYVLTTELTAAAGSGSSTPSMPVITTQPFSASSSPVTISGTADLGTTISISGGASDASATTTASGDWNASVDLTPNSVNHLVIVAIDPSSNVSASSTLDVTYDTTAPVIAPHDDVTATATSSAGVYVSFDSPSVSDDFDASSTASCSPASMTLFAIGSTTVTCTAADSAGNTASSTNFNVIVALNTGSSTSTTTGTTVGSPQPPVFRPSGTRHPLPGVASITTTQLPQPILSFSTVLPRQEGIAFGTEISAIARTLGIGSQGSDVVSLQTRLSHAGVYHGPITGYFGRLTAAAVRSFQASMHMAVTGSVGPSMIEVLNND